ncbi:hypothetical protein Aduo_017277 [Ancylostoma duodenale]
MSSLCYLLALIFAVSQRSSASSPVPLAVDDDYPEIGFAKPYEPLSYASLPAETTVLPSALNAPIMSAPVISPASFAASAVAPEVAPAVASAVAPALAQAVAPMPLFAQQLISSAVPYASLSHYYHPQTLLRNLVRDYSKEAGHLSATAESIESTPILSIAVASAPVVAVAPAAAAPVVNFAPAPAVEVAPVAAAPVAKVAAVAKAPAVPVPPAPPMPVVKPAPAATATITPVKHEPAYPTLLRASVQRKLFATKKAAAQRKASEKIKA